MRNLDQRMERDGERWLDELDPVVELPRPFCHPMPYCVCKECTSIGELGTEVFERNGMEWCRITIANLTIAIDFFRNNGGRGDPGYQRLLVARQQQSDNQWQNLPYAIRERISEWFTRQGGEKFLGFFPDVDFAKAETGIAGLVLTDQRMVYKKYACCREFALRAGGRIDVEATRSRAVVSIRQDGKDDADLNTKPLQAGSLARTLTDLSPLWAIRVEARE